MWGTFCYTMEFSYLYMCVCPTLSDTMDCSLPGSSLHEILQARILEWVASSCSRDLYMYVSPYVSILYIYNFSSVAQLCPTLCSPMDCSKPGFPVQHQLPELAQTHVHRVGDAIQPSHSLSPPSPSALSFPASGSFLVSQLFALGGQSIGVSASASVLPMNIQD